MAVTLEITVNSVDAYRKVLKMLKAAQERGELACEFHASPSQDSIAAIAEAEAGQRPDHMRD